MHKPLSSCKTWADAVESAHQEAPLRPITLKHKELRELWEQFDEFTRAAVAEERFVARALLVLTAATALDQRRTTIVEH